MSSHPVAAYVEGERREFECLNIAYESITHDGVVVITTLSSASLSAYLQVIFGVDALPSYTVGSSVELRSLSIFSPEW